MAALILPSRRIVTPQQGYALDRDAAAQSGTIFLTFPDKELRDEITGKKLNNPGGLSYGPNGQTATFNGSQQGNLAFPLPNGALNLIVAARIRATAAQAGTPGAAFGLYASSGNQSGFAVGSNSAGTQLGFTCLTNNGAYASAVSAVPLDSWATVFVQCQGLGSGNETQIAYINGKPAEFNQGDIISGSPSAGLNEISIGAQHRSAGFLRQFKGDIEWASLLYVPGETWQSLTDDLAARLYESNYPYNLLKPIERRIWVGGASVSLPTLVQPSSTTSTGAWTPTGAATLHQAINEPTASASEFISVSSASTCVMELANAAFPGAANQTLSYRASSTLGSNLTVTLRQGATQIMTRTHSLAATDTLYTQTLTAPEIATIVAGPVTVELTAS